VLSLREAANLANALPGNATVSFADSLGFGTVTLTAGQLEISGTAGVKTIEGGSRFGINGNGTTRLFQIDSGTQAVLSGLDLGGGYAINGGGVLNQGTLTVAGCTLWGNTADNGGAIDNERFLTLQGSTVEFGIAVLGAGIYNAFQLTASNSTFVYNSAVTAGGAIYIAASGTATLTSLTVSRNSANTGGGLDVLAGSTAVVRNCIVAGNYDADDTGASDIAGTVASTSSYNLIGTGGSGGLLDGVNHNHVGVADPGLTTPDFDVSQTPVFGFTTSSPALGAGDPTLLSDPLLRLDQHGNLRGSSPNIGAL
jgi:predicted outer membrane repeat protein